MTRADMDQVRDQFVRAAEMAERAGFDMLELHVAHGYLLSAFITPLTNRRTDAYGGSLENRMRYPLEVFRAVRAAWPEQQADLGAHLGQRLGRATDGITPEDSVEIARLLQTAGVDIIDVSAGPDLHAARPVYGRMFQTPFSDRIRNEVGIATMAVGNIYRARSRQLDPDGGPRGSVLPGAPASRRSLLDAARRRRSSATAARHGRRLISQAATSCIAWPSAPKPQRRRCDGGPAATCGTRSPRGPSLKLRLLGSPAAGRACWMEVDLRGACAPSSATTLPRFDVMAALGARGRAV